MADSDNTREVKQEPKIAGAAGTQPSALPPQQPPPTPHGAAAAGDPQPRRPLLVQLVARDELEPFEVQSLAIARESLAISRSSERIAIGAFAAAIIAAVFVYFQVKVMSYQTQVMGAQSESAAGSAAAGEWNTRKQLEIAQQQARAAQDSVAAINKQMRQDQRAWIKFGPQEDTPGGDKSTIQITAGQPVAYPLRVANIGKTSAKNVDAKVFVEIVDASREPSLNHIENAKLGSPEPLTIISAGILFPTTDFKQKVYRVIKSGGSDPLVATNDEVIALTTGKAYLAVYGIITYDDVFQTPHWTRFCDWRSFANGLYSTYKCTEFNGVDNN